MFNVLELFEKMGDGTYMYLTDPGGEKYVVEKGKTLWQITCISLSGEPVIKIYEEEYANANYQLPDYLDEKLGGMRVTGYREPHLEEVSSKIDGEYLLYTPRENRIFVCEGDLFLYEIPLTELHRALSRLPIQKPLTLAYLNCVPKGLENICV